VGVVSQCSLRYSVLYPRKNCYNALKVMMDLRKAVLVFAGTVFVSLGVLGMFLPLLPTTVFLLLAAYCYSRSSERFHNWLLSNKLFGSYINNYQAGKGISIRQKVTTLTFLWASIGLSIWWLGAAMWVIVLLAVVAIGVTIHILWLKTYRPEPVRMDDGIVTETDQAAIAPFTQP
jgi:uncharacterized protein